MGKGSEKTTAKHKESACGSWSQFCVCVCVCDVYLLCFLVFWPQGMWDLRGKGSEKTTAKHKESACGSWSQFCVCVCVCDVYLLCFLVFWPQGMWDLSFPTRYWTCTPCIGRQSLNYWTTREVSMVMNLKQSQSGCPCVSPTTFSCTDAVLEQAESWI